MVYLMKVWPFRVTFVPAATRPPMGIILGGARLGYQPRFLNCSRFFTFLLSKKVLVIHWISGHQWSSLLRGW